MNKTEFFAKMTPDEISGCWLWTGSKNRDGYGRYNRGGKQVAAHRKAYELTRGEIPPGMVIDHICHTRSCINPDHLRVCTVRGNARNRDKGSTNTSGYKGVWLGKRGKPYIAMIWVNGKNKYLGSFNTPEEAHQAYKTAAIEHFGEFARF